MRFVLKLFLMIAAAFAVFITGVLLLQTAFFESFYIRAKTDAFKTAFHELTYAVHDTEADRDTLMNKLDDFSRAYNAHATVFELTAEPGIPAGSFSSAPSPTARREQIRPERLPAPRVLIETDRETMRSLTRVAAELPELVAGFGQEQPVVVFHQGASDYIYGISSARINGNDCVLFSSASMQPVGEAVSALRDYYVYVYLGAIVSALCISLAISRLLARPLILANDQLSADLEKEKRLDAMRKTFIASASHELKTPLGLIGGYTEALRDGMAPEEAERFLDIIADETQKMGALVREMLELSMLQDENRRLATGTVALSTAIDGCLRKFTSQLRGKTLSVALAPTAETVTADAGKLEQALTNILDNAIRHTPDGGAIRITSADHADAVELSIANEGRPISEAKLPRIWESFYRADTESSRQTGNYGIGLSIVKQIMSLHGGEAYAVNTADGVAFILRFPRHTAEVQKNGEEIMQK